MYAQHYCHFVSRLPLRFLLLALGTRAYAESSPVTQTLQVDSVPLGLVATQAPLISSGTRLAKLPFFQKAVTVIMIVEFACVFKTTMNGGRGHMYETN